MLRSIVLGFCLLPMLAVADTDDQDLAYSLGASLGERLRQEMPGLQLDALVEGLRQSYQEQPLKLSQARMQALLEQHQPQQDAAPQAPEAAEIRFMANERARAGVHELMKGVLYSELQAGSGPQPKAGAKVLVNYVGRLPSGEVFDQSREPQWFSLDSVIEGWQMALPQMHVGAKWRLVIPSALAYGADGAGDLIAPYTPLVFEIQLLQTKD
ncbi:domain amino terminal to FKBP-type peptidyl-prolyl isomerase family protein [Pseudomonas putida S610]|uniref:FKBP-type peptidyl-prolyl cis-trans isomerase n=1 Tax=Pseudomonas putida group TaxID=136845 RepID=UPI0003C57BD8|nr:FKBP-type peptidyl-prolyl cis-trans isomerase [Pseudomonas putida]EST14266.1 domain amino terminal to FKBP-type peptidyl-prolyl isomerase family protein [Pseudomonas putida S610]